jgi:glycosyltransferase involved in cell wall biosynthesis
MKSKPKISVILTIYNAEKYLPETIDSLLNQSFRDFELIAVNDKSKDKSLDIIKGYMKKDKRIILINNKKNVGPTTSLNIGLEVARGKYVAISDHDDISLPTRLETEYNFLEKNKDIFLVGSGAININEKGIKLGTFRPITSPKNIEKTLINRNCFYHPTIMFRNEKGIKYRDKIYYAHDRDLYLSLLSKKRKLANLSEPLVKYRIHSKQLSVSKRSIQFLFSEKAKEFYQQRQKYGKDNYGSFNPNEILNLNLEKTDNPHLLKIEIFGSFISEDYKKSLKLSKEYINLYGFFNKIGIYFILSWFGSKSKIFCSFNRCLRKLLSNLLNWSKRV